MALAKKLVKKVSIGKEQSVVCLDNASHCSG